MGLLDDAIREHLDLKRRRGADPAEVERAEQEALGPVRRNRDPDETADPQEQVPATGGFAYDQDDDQDWHEPAVAGADLSDPHAAFDEEPEFDPVQPPPPVERGSVRPHSLGEPSDHQESASDTRQEDPFAEPDAPRRDDTVAPASDWSAHDDEAFAAEPFPPASDSPGRAADATGQETSEYHIEEEEHEPRREDGEDVLEETPEFLQDTPDHDRLWFEQRPPRDFDFDG